MRIVSIAEACERLGVSRSTLYSEARAGRIAIVRFGGRSGVTDTEIERVIAEATTRAKRPLLAA